MKTKKCESCEKSFSQGGGLKRHIRTVHEGQKDHKCESCGKSFSESGSLKKHIHRIHKEGTPKLDETKQQKDLICNQYANGEQAIIVTPEGNTFGNEEFDSEDEVAAAAVLASQKRKLFLKLGYES